MDDLGVAPWIGNHNSELLFNMPFKILWPHKSKSSLRYHYPNDHIYSMRQSICPNDNCVIETFVIPNHCCYPNWWRIRILGVKSRCIRPLSSENFGWFWLCCLHSNLCLSPDRFTACFRHGTLLQGFLQGEDPLPGPGNGRFIHKVSSTGDFWRGK